MMGELASWLRCVEADRRPYDLAGWKAMVAALMVATHYLLRRSRTEKASGPPSRGSRARGFNHQAAAGFLHYMDVKDARSTV